MRDKTWQTEIVKHTTASATDELEPHKDADHGNVTDIVES